MIDVRTLREYAGGHPEDAYNVPFPNIYVSGDQDPQKFYWEVYDIVKGNLDTPVMLLCRTGSRSIRAGNVLADPESDPATAGLGLLPFTNVTNIWEGYVGLYRYAFTGNPPLPDPTKPLDLNNDEIINVDYPDVHVETKDANPDKDGWRNFAGLPWTTKIRKPLAYEQDPSYYDALNLTPVQ
jgi:rhodanese-related sulfurtransferase